MRSGMTYCKKDSEKVGQRFDASKGVTVQSEKENCDINVIVSRFHKTGLLPVRREPLSYQAFTGIFDFSTAMDAVVKAREEFMKVPAAVRKRFHNDPQEFVEFCSKEENLPELRKLGLAEPEKVPPKEEATEGAS